MLNNRLTVITTSQQDQLDDIYFNHLAIPGMINAKMEVDDPLESAFPSDDNTADENGASTEKTPKMTDAERAEAI